MATNLTVYSGTAAYTTGKFGQGKDTNWQALTTATPTFAASSSGTVEFWFKTVQTSVGVFMTTTANTNAAIIIGVNGGKYSNSIFGTQHFTLSPNPTINDGAWHHCAITFSGTVASFYHDGALLGTLDASTMSQASFASYAGTSLAFGGYYNQGYLFDGQMDDIAISTTVQYTGATYTVPTSPISDTRPGQVAVYHFESPSPLADTNGVAPTAPGQVTGVTLTPGATTMGVAWTAPSGTPPITYTVNERVTGGTGWTPATATASASPYTITGLAPSTSYDVQVVATNSVASGPASATATASTTAAPLSAPGQVTGLTAGLATTTTVPLTWTAPSTGGAVATYTVNYRTPPGSGAWTPASTTITASSYTVAGLTSGLNYEFQAIAANSAGPGPASASITAATAAGAVTNSPDDAGLLYSPYNWQVTHASAVSWNPGAYIRTLFSGASCVLNFDITANTGVLPQIWWRIDNGPWNQANVAATITCSIPAVLTSNSNVPYHLLEVVFKSMDWTSAATPARWSGASTTLTFKGLTLASGGALLAPSRAAVNVLIYGDSITEGIWTCGQAGAQPDNDDARLCWAFEMGRLLGAEVGVVGFGGTGYLAAGSGGVPAFPATYNLIASGVARTFTPSPDLIIVNHGTNDIYHSLGDFTSAATTALNALLAACPASKIALLNPFSYPDSAFLKTALASCIAPARVRFISTVGFFNTAYGHDTLNLHPAGPNSVGLIAPKVAAAVRPLMPQPARWTH